MKVSEIKIDKPELADTLIKMVNLISKEGLDGAIIPVGLVGEDFSISINIERMNCCGSKQVFNLPYEDRDEVLGETDDCISISIQE